MTGQLGLFEEAKVEVKDPEPVTVTTGYCLAARLSVFSRCLAIIRTPSGTGPHAASRRAGPLGWALRRMRTLQIEYRIFNLHEPLPIVNRLKRGA